MHHTPAHARAVAPLLDHRGTRFAPLAALIYCGVFMAGCSVPPLDVDNKSCPCAHGWVCDTNQGRCVRPTAPREMGTDPAGRDNSVFDAGGMVGGDAALAPEVSDGAPVPDALAPGADAHGPEWDAALRDAGTPDAAPPDAAADAGLTDAGLWDGAVRDGASDDAGPVEPCDTVLKPNERLYLGEYRCSPNGHYRFGLSEGGNLEMRRGSLLVWSAGLCCDAQRLVMQFDGNLVVRTLDGEPRYASGTPGHSGAFLSVEDSGRAVIWFEGTILWSSERTDAEWNEGARAY